jgi:hypothetical protein
MDPLNNAPLFWEYPGGGANPFGANEFQPALTIDSIHQDISLLYLNGFRGICIQENPEVVGIGEFDQMARIVTDASRAPYFAPGQAGQLRLDAQWNMWYPSVGVPVGKSPHGMIVGMMAGTPNKPWPPHLGMSLNHLFVESNGADPFVPASFAMGYLMAQISFQAQFLSNHFGRCFWSPSTDGLSPGDETYKTWKGWFGGLAVTKANMWFTGGQTTGYDYTTTAGFGLLLTNNLFVDVWQDVDDERPPIIHRMDATNHVISKFMKDGSHLVWMANVGTISTNLTVYFTNLAIPTNMVCAVTEIWTNQPIGTYTNSMTLTIPALDSFLVKIVPSQGSSAGTNRISLVYDGTGGAGGGGTGFIRVNNTNSIQMSPNGPVGIGVSPLADAALAVGKNVNSLVLYDGANYKFVRENAVTGLLKITGDQGQANTGLLFYKDGAGSPVEMSRLFGNTVLMCDSNNPATWPTVANSRGGIAIVTSNHVPYVLTSTPGSTTWAETNYLGVRWVKNIIQGGALTSVSLASGNNWAAPAGFATPTSSGDQRIQLNFNGGYLSNLWVMRTNTFPSTTNIVFTIQTNTIDGSATAISALVDSALTCTMVGNTACTTNSGNTFIALPAGDRNYWTLKMAVNGAASGMAGHPITWSVEWWHQVP